MKTIERRKGQLLKYKIVNYRLNERPDKNEEKVVEEEEVGQEGENDEHGDEKDAGNQVKYVKHGGKAKVS